MQCERIESSTTLRHKSWFMTGKTSCKGRELFGYRFESAIMPHIAMRQENKGMTMEIRNYVSADQEQVVDLWNDVFPYSTGHNDPAIAINRKVRTDDGLFFVATEERSVVGTAIAGYDGHRGWLYSVAVSNRFRRQGVGTLLVRHAELALAELGCPKMNLQVRADNSDVSSFYESLGFRIEERISMGKIIGS